jgi:hypothetical protein
MRSLFVLTLSLTAILARAQSEEPFKGANKIIFECKDSAENLYVRLGKHLISKGYAITGDKDFLNIKTRRRGISKFSPYTYTVNSIVQDNRVMVTIDLSGVRDGTFQTIDWEYSTMPVVIGKSVHEHFLEHMAAFEKTKIYYDRY